MGDGECFADASGKLVSRGVTGLLSFFFFFVFFLFPRNRRPLLRSSAGEEADEDGDDAVEALGSYDARTIEFFLSLLLGNGFRTSPVVVVASWGRGRPCRCSQHDLFIIIARTADFALLCSRCSPRPLPSAPRTSCRAPTSNTTAALNNGNQKLNTIFFLINRFKQKHIAQNRSDNKACPSSNKSESLDENKAYGKKQKIKSSIIKLFLFHTTYYIWS